MIIPNTSKLRRKIWKNKKILREIYQDWYKQIITDLKPSGNRTLEIGAGSGNFKEFKPDIIACDIEPNKWLDRTFDAHKIPFKNGSIGNIVLIDTLHHLSDPIAFLYEAGRVLEKNGRLIMIEPFPSPLSLLVYRIFHPEPFIMDADYFNSKKTKKHQNSLYTPNQAIPFLLFFKNYQKTKEIFEKTFCLTKRKKICFILYPASGGFRNVSLIPDSMISFMKYLEYLLLPLKNLLAFRCYIVLERKQFI